MTSLEGTLRLLFVAESHKETKMMNTTMTKNSDGSTTIPMYTREGWMLGEATFMTEQQVQKFLNYNQAEIGKTEGNVTFITLHRQN